MQKTKLITVVFTALFAFLLTATPVMATEVNNTTDNTLNNETLSNEINTNTVNTIDNTADNTVIDNTIDNNVNQPGDLMSLTDLTNLITVKLNQILEAIKAIAKPVVMIMFVSAAFMALFGAFNPKGGIWKGVAAMVVAALTLSVVLYSDLIVSLFMT